MQGEDVLALAQPGTGKTAAFAIPVIDRIYAAKTLRRSLFFKCLIMFPPRELALQIGEVFKALGESTKVKIELKYKELNIPESELNLVGEIKASVKAIVDSDWKSFFIELPDNLDRINEVAVVLESKMAEGKNAYIDIADMKFFPANWVSEKN